MPTPPAGHFEISLHMRSLQKYFFAVLSLSLRGLARSLCVGDSRQNTQTKISAIRGLLFQQGKRKQTSKSQNTSSEMSSVKKFKQRKWIETVERLVVARVEGKGRIRRAQDFQSSDDILCDTTTMDIVGVQSLNHVQLLVIPWTVACQALLSVDFRGKNAGVGCMRSS